MFQDARAAEEMPLTPVNLCLPLFTFALCSQLCLKAFAGFKKKKEVGKNLLTQIMKQKATTAKQMNIAQTIFHPSIIC